MTDTTQWRAFLSEPGGWIVDHPDDIAHMLGDEDARGEISIRRGTALPDEHGHLPGSYTAADVFMELDLDDVEIEDAEEVWRLAQAAAWGMSQPDDVRAAREVEQP